MAEHVTINEVGPRDGLQNQAKILSVDARLQLINALVAAGIRALEIGSFVSPKAVPAMADTAQVVRKLPHFDQLNYSALVPNTKGYELASAAGIKSIAVVLSATETMNQRNIGMSLDHATAVCEDIMKRCVADKRQGRAYISVAFGCPYEGEVALTTVRELAQRMLAAGAGEVIIADTIGAADPAQVRTAMQGLVAEHGTQPLSCHFHDTRGMGLANVYAALEEGIRKFDTAIGGLGGCPFAPGASGNVATEDVVLMLQQMGFDTGIDLPGLVTAVTLAGELTDNCYGGSAFRWLSLARR